MFTLMMTGTILVAAAVAAMSVMVAQTAPAEAALESPFGTVGTTSADTLEGGMNFRVFPSATPGEWQVMSFESLAEVEAALDSLENHGVKDREALVLSNNCFAVRYKI